MRITIFAAGSRGDIQPGMVLGRALSLEGYNVTVAAPENFAALAQGQGLRFHPLSGDVQQIMASETGRELMERGGLLRSITAIRAMLGPVALRMAEDALQASRNADALISLSVFATLGSTVAEIAGIPLIHLEPTPVLPTGAFPAAGWPVQRDLGRLHNRFSGHAMLHLIWQWYRPFVNQFRRSHGLAPYTGGVFYRALTSAPVLGAYSPAVVPRPRDWHARAHVTGYLFPEADNEWRPSPELEAFLQAGEPPVYVGFGSMSGRGPDRMASIVLEALARSGQRGLLLTGWGGIQAMSVPEEVFVMDSAPHSWLFPHTAAVVHHGGAGTTAEGLRAGVPSIVAPFMMDQPFWGRRVKALGVGPDPIPRKQLSADRLAAAIDEAVNGQAMRQRAAALGRVIRAEDGVSKAVTVIRRHVGA